MDLQARVNTQQEWLGWIGWASTHQWSAKGAPVLLQDRCIFRDERLVQALLSLEAVASVSADGVVGWLAGWLAMVSNPPRITNKRKNPTDILFWWNALAGTAVYLQVLWFIFRQPLLLRFRENMFSSQGLYHLWDYIHNLWMVTMECDTQKGALLLPANMIWDACLSFTVLATVTYCNNVQEHMCQQTTTWLDSIEILWMQ